MTTPIIPVPPLGDDDPLGIDAGSAEERREASEAEHDEQDPDVITLDEVERATGPAD